MSKRKASPETGVSSTSWKDSARALEQSINTAAQDDLVAISAKLVALEELATARLNGMKSKVGLGVVLVDADESQVVHEVCSRNIEAKFTAGPRQLAFWINFEYSNDHGCVEARVEAGYGDEGAGLFLLEEDDFSGDPPTDDEIVDFLGQAGLKDAVPTCAQAADASAAEGGLTDAVRMRFVYCQIFSEAVALVESEYGAKDSLGLGLGMTTQDIFTFAFPTEEDELEI